MLARPPREDLVAPPRFNAANICSSNARHARRAGIRSGPDQQQLGSRRPRARGEADRSLPIAAINAPAPGMPSTSLKDAASNADPRRHEAHSIESGEQRQIEALDRTDRQRCVCNAHVVFGMVTSGART